MTGLRVEPGVEIGVATHAGSVRVENEDDFLLLSVPRADAGDRAFLLAAIADGMGGLAGGGDASRAAVRALGATCAERADEADGSQVLSAGFEVAATRLREIAAENSRLAGLGTTLTALWIRPTGCFLGHVGDSRCLRLRRGGVEQLTVDHALEAPRHLLTRCLGAGQDGADGDFAAIDLRAGDVFVLCTDGAWSLLEPSEFAAELRGGSLQAGCEKLARLVLQRGAPDNVTLVAVRVDPTASGEVCELELPTGEVHPELAVRSSSASLRPARWPWLVLVLAGLIAALAWARWRHGFDAWSALRELWRG